MSFSIIFFSNTKDVNVVDKLTYLTQVITVNGVLREGSSVVNPSVLIELEEVPSFNYAYIQQFNRYYFVNDISSVHNNVWSVSMTVDVLTTYSGALANCTAYVDRSENIYNPLITDNQLVIYHNPIVETTVIENDLFTDYEGDVLVTGIGIATVVFKKPSEE